MPESYPHVGFSQPPSTGEASYKGKVPTGPSMDTPKDGEVGQPPRAIKPMIPTIPPTDPNTTWSRASKGHKNLELGPGSSPIVRS